MQRLVNNIFNYKVEMMGFAILLIMLFHLALPTTLWGLKNTFEIGVDLFLFLGGFTCARSYLIYRLPNCGVSNRYSVFIKKEFGGYCHHSCCCMCLCTDMSICGTIREIG